MLGYFRRRKREAAFQRIAEALAAHSVYQHEHSMRRTRPRERYPIFVHYSHDQMIEAVFQRTVRLYDRERKKPPNELRVWVAELVGDPE